MSVDLQNRFVAAHASGRRCEETPATEVVRGAHARSRSQPVDWCSDDWWAYPKALTRAHCRAVGTGRRGRPLLHVSGGLSLKQTIKHRNRREWLLGVEIRATIGGAVVEQPVPVCGERLNVAFRDLLACLTRKTQAFAKSASMWDVLLSQPSTTVPKRCYGRCTPAMAIGLADGRWPWPEFLTTKAIVSF